MVGYISYSSAAWFSLLAACLLQLLLSARLRTAALALASCLFLFEVRRSRSVQQLVLPLLLGKIMMQTNLAFNTTYYNTRVLHHTIITHIPSLVQKCVVTVVRVLIVQYRCLDQKQYPSKQVNLSHDSFTKQWRAVCLKLAGWCCFTLTASHHCLFLPQTITSLTMRSLSLYLLLLDWSDIFVERHSSITGCLLPTTLLLLRVPEIFEPV